VINALEPIRPVTWSRMWKIGFTVFVLIPVLSVIGYMWWMTMPIHQPNMPDTLMTACPSILPAPRGCAVDARTPVAAIWTAIISVVGIGFVAVVHHAKPGNNRWLQIALGITLLVVSLIGMRSVLYAY